MIHCVPFLHCSFLSLPYHLIRLIAQATPPFRIIHANKAFHNMAQGLNATSTGERRLGAVLKVLQPLEKCKDRCHATFKPYQDICQDLCHLYHGKLHHHHHQQLLHQQDLAVLRLPKCSQGGDDQKYQQLPCRTCITPVWDRCTTTLINAQRMSHIRIEVEPRRKRKMNEEVEASIAFPTCISKPSPSSVISNSVDGDSPTEKLLETIG